ncbi:hypothetical protein L1887_26040 [Cichorium endivia]|nr:hypothetical protein L1887_26040 [Cichorium endivia]
MYKYRHRFENKTQTPLANSRSIFVFVNLDGDVTLAYTHDIILPRDRSTLLPVLLVVIVNVNSLSYANPNP